MRFDAPVIETTRRGRVQRRAVARRIIALPPPSEPLQGDLESVAGRLLARAAPFDQPAQALMCVQWGLPVPPRSGFVGYLDPSPDTAPWRLIGVRRQLNRLAAQCGPPAPLIAALDLAASQPAATERQL